MGREDLQAFFMEDETMEKRSNVFLIRGSKSSLKNNCQGLSGRDSGTITLCLEMAREVLVSGDKESRYSLIHAITNGHEKLVSA